MLSLMCVVFVCFFQKLFIGCKGTAIYSIKYIKFFDNFYRINRYC